jgi:IPT/TIG domain
VGATGTVPTTDKVEWLSPELGTLTPSTASDGATAHYSVAGKVERPVTLTVLARIGGANPRIAGAWVTVLPASSSLGTIIEACGTDAESLLRLIALMGALGGIIHGISSFTTFVGNRELKVSWVWWYVFKPFLSALVALVVFLVFRGGFSSTDYALAAADCLKVAAFAGLIGLFAEPATLKLRDIFETIFTPRNDPRRDAAGQVKPSGPQLDSISPTTLTVGQANLPALTLNGSGFAKDCQVKIGDTLRKTSKWTATQLTVPLLPADVEKEGKLEVIVYNKPPNDEPSNAKEITVAKKEGAAGGAGAPGGG